MAEKTEGAKAERLRRIARNLEPLGDELGTEEETPADAVAFLDQLADALAQQDQVTSGVGEAAEDRETELSACVAALERIGSEVQEVGTGNGEVRTVYPFGPRAAMEARGALAETTFTPEPQQEVGAGPTLSSEDAAALLIALSQEEARAVVEAVLPAMEGSVGARIAERLSHFAFPDRPHKMPTAPGCSREIRQVVEYLEEAVEVGRLDADTTEPHLTFLRTLPATQQQEVDGEGAEPAEQWEKVAVADLREGDAFRMYLIVNNDDGYKWCRGKVLGVTEDEVEIEYWDGSKRFRLDRTRPAGFWVRFTR